MVVSLLSGSAETVVRRLDNVVLHTIKWTDYQVDGLALEAGIIDNQIATSSSKSIPPEASAA